MILRRLGQMNKNQRGFALIEVLIVIAITGIISGGITTAIFQVFDVNARSTAHMTAVKQVESAVYWISRDAQMAQGVVTGDDPETEFLILTWADWYYTEGQVTYTAHQVTYSIANGELKRSHLSVSPEHPSETTEAVVARHIDPEMTNFNFTDDGVLTFELTASVDKGSGTQSETRVCEVIPRPNL